MNMLKQTNEAAKELGISESRARAMRKRGHLVPSAVTANGAGLYTDADIRSAQQFLANTAAKSEFSQGLDSRK